MRRKVVRGHKLFAHFGPDGMTGKCECGWESEKRLSDGEIERAHREHKLEVLRGEAGVSDERE